MPSDSAHAVLEIIPYDVVALIAEVLFRVYGIIARLASRALDC